MALFKPTAQETRLAMIGYIHQFACWDKDVTSFPWNIKSHRRAWMIVQNCGFVHKKENSYWVDNSCGE